MYKNCYDYEMCCFKREMSAPERLIDSKVWYSYYAFYLNYYRYNDNTRRKKTKNMIKSKNYPKSKTVRELEKFDFD